MMATLRHRRFLGGFATPATPAVQQNKIWYRYWEVIPGRKPWKKMSFIIGGIIGISMGILTAMYVATLHENDLWFSSITEVEREISFRTECGLYYSYYKQILEAPNIQLGLQNLIYDNKTESMRTVNILKRMNVYQEVILAILYKMFHIKDFLEPVYFYIYTLFGLQAIYIAALYVTSWILSGTWLSGVLTTFWFITNRIDATRVEFTIPLRENWALPLFAIQVAAITFLFRNNLRSASEPLTFVIIFISTFLFSLAWQFNQFMLLIQALVLFSLDCLDLLPTEKVTKIYLIQIISLLLVYLLQFFNSMILGSLLLSFNVTSLIVRKLQNDLKYGDLSTRIGKIMLHAFFVLIFTVLINSFIKKILHLESDEHIFKFLNAKFGFGKTRDFDANLYLCEEAFGNLPSDTFTRLKETLVLQFYMFVLFATIITAGFVAFLNLKGYPNFRITCILQKCVSLMKPGAAYNLLHTILFGLLAYSIMRMKYLWISHMCVFAAAGVCSADFWGLFLRVIRVHTPRRVSVLRYLTPILIIMYLSLQYWSRIRAELSELREFYDPDTVELMDWIKAHTPKNAVIAGSMQLLAGVKLCTGRIVTNHPHYEDKDLRERTKQVYQVYAKRSPEDVYKILMSFGTDFVILEDSICYERRHHRGCRLRDLLDVENGHIMDDLGPNDADLKQSEYPRFCSEIKSGTFLYSKYFSRVFQNKTFHVYKLAELKKISNETRH